MLRLSIIFATALMFGSDGFENADRKRSSDTLSSLNNEVTSQVRSNLALVLPLSTPGNRLSDRPLQIGFVSTDGNPRLVFLLRPDYGFRISAVSEKGEALPFTKKGIAFSNELKMAKGYDKAILAKFFSRGGPRGISSLTMASDKPSSVEFPSPDSLFQFPRPGQYTLTMEVQVLTCPLGCDVRGARAVRFPPVRVVVEKVIAPRA